MFCSNFQLIDNNFFEYFKYETYLYLGHLKYTYDIFETQFILILI